MKDVAGVYKYTNINTGALYIGSAKNVWERYKQHLNTLCIDVAIANEGIENFTFEIVCQCKAEELNEKEKYFIGFFKSCEWGYNTQQGTQ